jgi:hypothetical protein
MPGEERRERERVSGGGHIRVRRRRGGKRPLYLKEASSSICQDSPQTGVESQMK